MLRDSEIEPTCRVGAAIAALLSVVAMVVGVSACIDHKCPKGYRQEGDTCFRIKDAGAGDGSIELEDGSIELEMDAEPAISGDGSSDDAEQEPEDVGGSGDADKPEAGAIDSGACTGSDCPECDDGNPCTGEHELCVGNQCVVQPYCGDGKKGADEDCDPAHPSWSPWTCSDACKVTTTYAACGGNPADPQGGCATGETCMMGACYSRCNVPGDCPATPPGTSAAPICYMDVLGTCMLTGCKSAADCPPGLVCIYSAAPTVQANICTECSTANACRTGLTCNLAAPGDKFRRCQP